MAKPIQIPIDRIGTGDGVAIVEGVPGAQICVWCYTIIVDASIGARWKSGSNNLSGQMTFGANGGSIPSGTVPVLITNPGEALYLNLAASAIQVSGHLTYTVETL